jgi:hypothetical protein
MGSIVSRSLRSFPAKPSRPACRTSNTVLLTDPSPAVITSTSHTTSPTRSKQTRSLSTSSQPWRRTPDCFAADTVTGSWRCSPAALPPSKSRHAARSYDRDRRSPVRARSTPNTPSSASGAGHADHIRRSASRLGPIDNHRFCRWSAPVEPRSPYPGADRGWEISRAHHR